MISKMKYLLTPWLVLISSFQLNAGNKGGVSENLTVPHPDDDARLEETISTRNARKRADEKTWKFVSIPDFLNVDVNYPEPTWDDALDYVLDCIKSENPDFVLVAGDLVMGRWWRTESQIEYMADIYYTAWIERMKAHNLDYYVVIGDHEVGDNPWLPEGKKNNRGMGTWDCAPVEFFPKYEEMFVSYFRMPDNGPEDRKGLSYSFVHNNTLFVAVDVFEKQFVQLEGRNGKGGTAKISESQLNWLESTLSRHQDVDHRIVFAHTPILGPVRKKSSSGMMYEGGRDSQFWQLMKTYDVDAYLCGEVHQMTCIEKDGIEQIAHGGLFGYNRDVNYLVATVSPDEIRLELKEIITDLHGRRLQQSGGNEPYEYVTISPENKRKGFQTVGTMVIKKDKGKKEFLSKTGYFLEDDNPKE